MKREFLKNFKVGDTELPKEVIDAILDENGRDIEGAKAPVAALTAERDDLKTQLTEAGKTIEGFKGMDIEAIRKEAEDYKAKAEQAEKNAAAQIAEMEFNGRLSAAITGAKGKNAKAVMALLDMDSLKASKNQEADIKAALEGLQKESGYLFESTETPPPFAPGAGKDPILSKPTNQMTYTEMCAYMERNPGAQI